MLCNCPEGKRAASSFFFGLPVNLPERSQPHFLSVALSLSLSLSLAGASEASQTWIV